MRVEIAGAQITSAVVEVIDTLQNQPEVMTAYTAAVALLTRRLILDADDADDTDTMAMLRALQLMISDLRTIAAPPDAHDEANDTPAAIL